MEFKTMKGFYTDELCPHCDEEVSIPAWKVSACPSCGRAIVPCSVCYNDETNCDECPFASDIKVFERVIMKGA